MLPENEPGLVQNGKPKGHSSNQKVRMIRFATVTFVFLWLFMCVFQKGVAQSVTISGVVRDSITNYILSGVSVTAYYVQDSSLAGAQITNNAGAFNIKKSRVQEDIELSISFSGYHTLRQLIHSDSGQSAINMGTLMLLRNYEQLEDIIIESAPPVTMNGDTLEINPAAFRLGSNAVVEDLLRQVSGIVVWGDGTITVNGKKVSHVYVDGKPFLTNSARVVTQNLPKDIIQKVQVYAEENNGGEMTGLGMSDSLLTMNIQLKRGSKSGLLGKLEAAKGTDKRYELNAANIFFSPQSKLAVVADINNINKRISGTNAALENSTYKNPNPNLANAPDFEMDGITRAGFFGAIFQHGFQSAQRAFLNNDIGGEITRSENKGDVSTEINTRTLIDNFIQDTRQQLHSQKNNDETGASLSYLRRTHSKRLSLDADWSSQNQASKDNIRTDVSEAGALKSSGHLMTASGMQIRHFGFKGKYENTDAKNLGLKNYWVTFEGAHQDNLSHREVRNDFSSFVSGVPDILLDRRYQSELTVNHGKLWIAYPGLKRLLLGKKDLENFELSINHKLNVTRESGVNRVKDLDTLSKKYSSNPLLSFTNIADTIQNVPALTIAKSFQKHLIGRAYRNFKIRAVLKENLLTLNNRSDMANRNLDRRFSFFEPEFNLSFFHSNNTRELTINLKSLRNHKVPAIDWLFPVVDNMYLYNLRMGNPGLKTESISSNEVSMGYIRSEPGSKHHFSLSGKAGIDLVNRAISDSILNDEAGRRIIYPVNLSGKKALNTSLNGTYSTTFKKQSLQVGYDGEFHMARVPGYINTIFVISSYHTFNHKIGASYSIPERFNTEISQIISVNRFLFSSDPGSELRNILYTTSLSANFNLTSRCILSTSGQYVSGSYLNDQFLLWNMYLTYRLLKKEQLELKISAFDILKNYKNVSTLVGYNFNETKVSSGIQQFFMANISFYPRFFAGK